MVTCTVVKSCDGEAVLQGVVDCKGCDVADAEYDAQIERRNAEAAHWESQAQQLETWFDSMDNPPPDFVREQALAPHREQAQAARAAAEALPKLQAKDRKKHTHPAFACEKHVGKVEG